jgi:hypothetical protein
MIADSEDLFVFISARNYIFQPNLNRIKREIFVLNRDEKNNLFHFKPS